MRKQFARLLWASGALLLCVASVGRAQEPIIMTGTVRTEAGAPITAATVLIRSLNIAVQTREDGGYRLSIPATASGTHTVLVRRLGYKEVTASVTVGTKADPTKYAGMPNGLTTAAAATYFNTASRPGLIFYPGVTTYGTFGTAAGKKTPSYLMVYSELAFIQAEAAERGIGGLGAGQAAGFYNAAVRASFLQWGLTSADADAYLARSGVAYTPGANGLKQIGLQKWIALYSQGSEAWAEYRRTGNPASLVAGPAALFNQIPRRIPYSVDEQSVNTAARDAAVARQGPDNYLTRVYWDKP